MTSITVLADEVRTADGTVVAGRVLVARGDLPDALGWDLRPQGLCRGDVCVPVADVAPLLVGDRLDVAAVAGALGRAAAVDATAGVVAVAADPGRRRGALAEQIAPEFALPDLDGTVRSSTQWKGRKQLLVAFASW